MQKTETYNDLFSHEILKEKWNIYSYLSDRRQVVDTECLSSPPLEQPPCSIIQGSVSSCVLYAIFTADLPLAIHPHPSYTSSKDESCDSLAVTTYVDDVFVIVTDKTINQVTSKSQITVDKG